MEKTYQPTDEELIRWIGTWNKESEVLAAGYHFGAPWPLVPGEVVVIHSHGKYRRGVVVSVGRLNAKVALTTPSAVGTSQRYGFLSVVSGKSVPFSLVASASDAPEMVDGSFGESVAEPETIEAVAEPETIEADNRKYAEALAKIDEFWNREEPEPKTEAAPAADPVGSEVVEALELVWSKIRANHPELPPVVIVTGSGWIGSPRWGHFRHQGWQGRDSESRFGELFIAGESLDRGADRTVETMLHEAAHVLAGVRGLSDTSRQGRWHNKVFLKLAEELGLEHPSQKADPKHGYSGVEFTPGTREEYAEVIENLDRAIRLCIKAPVGATGSGDGAKVPTGPKGSGSKGSNSTNNMKAVCGCEDPRIIRASRKVLEAAPIVCGICREEFRAPDSDEE